MKQSKLIIAGISILVPTVVALLFIFTSSEAGLGPWVHRLPALNATINGCSAVVLLMALVMIKQGKETTHRNLMLLAFGLGTIFLVSYITYHASVPSTVFGDTNHDHQLSAAELSAVGGWRTTYIVFLLSHILMAVAGLPLVLLAIYYGLSGNRPAHKKVVRFTFPVWLYVAVSGVIVYFLISPYY